MSGVYLKEWIHKAEEDYEVAVALSRRRKRLAAGAGVRGATTAELPLTYSTRSTAHP